MEQDYGNVRYSESFRLHLRYANNKSNAGTVNVEIPIPWKTLINIWRALNRL